MKTRIQISGGLLALIMLLCASPLLAEEEIRIVRVNEGGELEARIGSSKFVYIDLYGIHVPNTPEARKRLRHLTRGHNATMDVIETTGNREVSAVVYARGVNVNAEMIRDGYARVGKCKGKFCSKWKKIEQNARDEQRGMWGD